MADEQRRRRGHRRVVHPGTGAAAESSEPQGAASGDDPQPTDDGERTNTATELSDAWWREQRPPHWE